LFFLAFEPVPKREGVFGLFLEQASEKPGNKSVKSINKASGEAKIKKNKGRVKRQSKNTWKKKKTCKWIAPFKGASSGHRLCQRPLTIVLILGFQPVFAKGSQGGDGGRIANVADAG
jgi:hypothetical protein